MLPPFRFRLPTVIWGMTVAGLAFAFTTLPRDESLNGPMMVMLVAAWIVGLIACWLGD